MSQVDIEERGDEHSDPEVEDQLYFRLYPNPEKPGAIAELSNGKLIRLSTRVADYLQGEPASSPKVLEVVERLQLRPENLRQRVDIAPRGKWHVSSLLKIQYELVSPNGDWKLLEKIARFLNPTVFLLSSVVLFAAGVISFFLRDVPAYASLVTPVNLLVFIGILPAIFITTVIHESAHALMLQRYGHGMRRAGAMLFFFMPSAFCDVTPAWLLPRRQRVVVCLAGAVTQLGLAGVAMIIATLISGDFRQILDLYAMAIALTACINLIPFVKFDGYLALISWLDAPALIERSREHVADLSARLIVTGEASAKFKPKLFLFGIMCYLTPPVLVIAALGSLMGTLVSLGVVGKVLICLALMVVFGSLVLQLQGVLTRMVALGATMLQRVVTVGLYVGLIVVALLIPVEQRGSGAFAPHESNQGVVVVAVPPALAEDEGDLTGDDVRLEERGIWRRPLAEGQLVGSAEECTADQLEQTPFYMPGVAAPAEYVCYEVQLSEGATLTEPGLASVALPSVTIGEYLYDRAIGIYWW